MFRNLIQTITGPNPLETDVAEAVKARTDGATQIVDVREPDEWAEGHIPGAMHIPLGQLQVQHKKLDPARPVITVCRSGGRSLNAANLLKDAGFADVKSITGGMGAWVRAGQPVKK